MAENLSNYTTPKQAEYFIQLGVPAETADCLMYEWKLKDGTIRYQIQARNLGGIKRKRHHAGKPCWSVAQLQKIFLTCVNSPNPFANFVVLNKGDLEVGLATAMMHYFYKYKLDFSKLKESCTEG